MIKIVGFCDFRCSCGARMVANVEPAEEAARIEKLWRVEHSGKGHAANAYRTSLSLQTETK